MTTALQVASGRAQNDQPAVVRYSDVKAHSLTRSVDLTGTVVSPQISTVAGEVAGLVTELQVREGDTVESGQVLAQLRRQRLELDLRAAEAQVEEDQTRLKLAKINLDRSRELFQKNVFSRQQLDDAAYAYEALGKRIERLEAEMARLRDELERTAIKAPFSGVVVGLRTQVGEWLEEGGAVVELMSLDGLEVEVQVPERHFPEVRVGTPANVSFESLPQSGFRLRIQRIIPRADTRARTFPVRLRLPRRAGAGVGMVARVSLLLGTQKQAILIPKDALIRDGDREYVYLLQKDDTVKQLDVRSGDSLGVWIAVEGPLGAGDRVVTRGNERLRPGQSVVAQPLEYPLP